mmetsp:Transcript_68794/g.165113  ORF Transcript_68794/g.165113 Transcript_68794/m.165113 type:complete len:728 (-) Transcript_68794:112-2295(-)
MVLLGTSPPGEGGGAAAVAQQLEQAQRDLLKATERVSRLVSRHVEEVTRDLRLREESLAKSRKHAGEELNTFNRPDVESSLKLPLREVATGAAEPDAAKPPEDEPPTMELNAAISCDQQRSRSLSVARTQASRASTPKLDAWNLVSGSAVAEVTNGHIEDIKSDTLGDKFNLLLKRDRSQSRSRMPSLALSSAWEASASMANSFNNKAWLAKEKELRRKAGRHQLFADPETLKAQVRERMIKPQYNVCNFYHVKGIAQKIARSKWFDDVTLVVIIFNALWLAVDADLNSADTLLDAEPPFIAMEMFFFAYFMGELLIRFLAFRQKRHAFRDKWFLFDLALVALMFVENVVMTIVVAMTGSESQLKSRSQIIKIFRIFRMIRMARMIRLLRAAPELMTLVRGILVAGRAVLCTLALLLLMVYVFAVAFRHMTRHMTSDSSIGQRFFSTVPEAMFNLLLASTVPDLTNMIDDIRGEEIVVAIGFVLFICLATFTIMNMLVGVLVEVVGVVAGVERESMLMEYAKVVIADALKTASGLEENCDFKVSRSEFEVLLLKPECFKVIEELGVDCLALVDYCEVIFQEEQQELDFEAFMEVIMQFRGTNTATVRDMVDLRKFMRQEHKALLATIAAASEDHKSGVKKKRTPPEELGNRLSGSILSPLHNSRRHSQTFLVPDPTTSASTQPDQLSLPTAVEDPKDGKPRISTASALPELEEVDLSQSKDDPEAEV